ncbi:MAG: hypothetical protein PHH71_00065 [Clostridia bacterium]|jgi:hypothetical protein|nr:hypothetical protein [Clostridia bacterium]MDD3862355.1 hypothetical protein [Clostridia bacterium]MDD4408291.1 hypothetical protein [Clostridia bacterium]
MYTQNMVKTLFTVYRFLERLANSIDRIINTRAVNACFVHLENTAYNYVEKVADDIMELTQRKITLINLKVITDNILENINQDFARFVIMKYIEDRSIFEISDALEVSMRTLSRWNNNAIIKGALYLRGNGLTLNVMVDLIKNENWIVQVFNEFNKKTREKLCIDKNIKIIQRACKEYNKFLC